MAQSLIYPQDAYNEELVSQVHPLDWKNPEPVDRYDLVVLGAGTAGLVVAAGAAGLGLGLKIALVEKHLMGGDCLNVGCVPSKTMIRSSRAVAAIQEARSFGVTASEAEVDFPAVMARVRQVRSSISDHDSAQRFQKLGIDVFFGKASFIDDQHVQAGDRTLRFKKAVIATGARATHPAIPGLSGADYLNNETVFTLVDRPRRLAIIGGGPIGCEFAQAFRRLGSEVILFHQNDHLLDREDPEAAKIVQNAFVREGIQLNLKTRVERVEKTDRGKVVYFNNGSVTVDEILVGAGRSPNIEELNLDAIGVQYDARRGVKVNDYLQTTNPRIYAAGDICMDWKFTHAADAAARIVIRNALFAPFGIARSKLSALTMPWVTFTDPEVARVGLDEREANRRGIAFETIMVPFDDLDRAIADGETEGFVKIIHKRGSDRILGATIVARHAGEMINEITLAIVAKRGLGTLASVIHPYPTQAEAIKRAADTYYRRALLTPTIRSVLGLVNKFS